jgi:hypothetical protein
VVKIIKVRSCFECPYCESNLNKNYNYSYYCTYDEDNHKKIDDRFTMQDWCPLQEDK